MRTRLSLELQRESDERKRFYRMSCADDRWPALSKRFATPKFRWEIERQELGEEPDSELLTPEEIARWQRRMQSLRNGHKQRVLLSE